MKPRPLLAVAAALLALAATPAAASKNCDRACLRNMLDRFVGAVIAHDPARVPLAIGFRETQNSVITPAGGGVWRTLTGLGVMQRRYVDPVTGNAALFAVAQEGSTPALLSLRLHVAKGRVDEAEWHVAHKGDPGINGKGSDVLFDLAKVTAMPPPQRSVPKSERLDRDALIAVTNSYFDGIVGGSGRTVLAHGGCGRFENGFEVTGQPIRGDDKSDGFEGKGDCTSGYKSLGVALVPARRFLVVDEEAQVVVASAVFVRKPGDKRRRLHFMEYFAIDHGKIRSVHAAMFYAAPDQPVPNWEPYEGNFPLLVNPVPTE